MRTRVLTAAVAVVLTASLAGCTASGTAAGSSVGSAAGAGMSVEQPAPAGAAKGVTADRSVVTTGTLRLVAGSPVRTATRITDLVEASGGSVAQSSEEPGGHAAADLTVRIPAAAFPRTLTAIEREADRVSTVSVHATDVTAQVTDYGVRIANLRTSIARLQQLLSKATSNADLVQLEGSLTDRQGSLEQLLAQQRELADEVTYATLTIAVVLPAAAPEAGPADFVSGLVAGTQGLVRTAAAVAIGLGVALPWLAALGALAAVATLVVRAVRRRTRPTSA